LLHRDAQPQELSSLLVFLTGGTVEQIETSILSSAEYFLRRGGGSNAGFVAAIYHDVLERAPDAAGKRSWEQALGHGLGRSQVATAILDSAEAGALVVTALYHRLLHRSADSAGLVALVRVFQGSVVDAVLQVIAGSEEYFARV
jgi:hypothetical protein